MPAFSVTPLTDVPPPQAADFPDFIQFQSAGTDLGLADADTLNFSTGLTATRGVGENVNVVTVTGRPAASVLTLYSAPDAIPPIAFFDGILFSTEWFSEITIASSDWTFNAATGITFVTGGIYQIIAQHYWEADIQWPAGTSTYGSMIGISEGVQARYHVLDDPVDTRNRMWWTDQHVISVLAGESVSCGLFGVATDSGAPVLFAGMTLVIERLGDNAY